MRLQTAMIVGLVFAMACSAADDPSSEDCAPEPGTACIWAGTGESGFNGDGHALRESRLYWPIDLEFAPDGTAYVLDWNNHLVRRVSEKGAFQTMVGAFVGDGAPGMADAMPPGALGTEVSLNHPTDLQIARDGTVVLAAWHNHKIRTLDPESDQVNVIAGSRPGFAGDGQAAHMAQFDQPKAIVFDRDENLYVLDQRNQRVRKLARDGVVSTVAGTGISGFFGDGGAPISAQLSFEAGPNPEPSGGLALDDAGRLYIADALNHCIRRVDFETNTIDTVAGNGLDGYDGDGGDARAALLGQVRDLEFGPDGRLYFADTDHHVIRALDLEQARIETVAGTGEEPAADDARIEGRPARETPLKRPMGVAFDPEGNLYIADSYNNRILKVSQ
jgi:sugar lactone lactonase YvrE